MLCDNSRKRNQLRSNGPIGTLLLFRLAFLRKYDKQRIVAKAQKITRVFVLPCVFPPNFFSSRCAAHIAIVRPLFVEIRSKWTVSLYDTFELKSDFGRSAALD